MLQVWKRSAILDKSPSPFFIRTQFLMAKSIVSNQQYINRNPRNSLAKSTGKKTTTSPSPDFWAQVLRISAAKHGLCWRESLLRSLPLQHAILKCMVCQGSELSIQKILPNNLLTHLIFGIDHAQVVGYTHKFTRYIHYLQPLPSAVETPLFLSPHWFFTPAMLLSPGGKNHPVPEIHLRQCPWESMWAGLKTICWGSPLCRATWEQDIYEVGS